MAFGLGALLASSDGTARGRARLRASARLARLRGDRFRLRGGLRRRDRAQPRPLARAWVSRSPLLLYVVWYSAGAQRVRARCPPTPSRPAPSTCSTGSPAASPRCSASATPSLLGGPGRARLGPAAAGGALRAAVWRLGARPRGPHRLGPRPARDRALTFWFLTAANAGSARPPDASRYQLRRRGLPAMIAAELGGGRLAPALGRARRWSSRSPPRRRRQPPRRSTRTTRHRRLPTAARARRPGRPRDRRRPGEAGLHSHPAELRLQVLRLVDAASATCSAADAVRVPGYSGSELARGVRGGRVSGPTWSLRRLALPRVSARWPSPRPPGAPQAWSERLDARAAPRATGRGQPRPRAARGSMPPPGVGAELRLRRFASASFPVDVGTLRGAARLDDPARPLGAPLGDAVGARGR